MEGEKSEGRKELEWEKKYDARKEINDGEIMVTTRRGAWNEEGKRSEEETSWMKNDGWRERKMMVVEEAKTNFPNSSLKLAQLSHLNFSRALNTRSHDHLLPKSALSEDVSRAEARSTNVTKISPNVI